MRAAALGADKSRGMRVIDRQDRAVTFCEHTDLRQRRDRAIHGKHAVGNDEARARALRLDQPRLEFGEISVRVAKLACLAEANPVNDRGVIERVGDDRVLLVEQRLEQPAVGVEAGGIKDRFLGAQETGQPRLELAMNALSTADKTHRSAAVTKAVERAVSGGEHGGMIGEPQVVVGAQVDDLGPAGDLNDGALRRVQHALGLESARRA